MNRNQQEVIEFLQEEICAGAMHGLAVVVIPTFIFPNIHKPFSLEASGGIVRVNRVPKACLRPKTSCSRTRILISNRFLLLD
jgi:hypothetical protein